MKGKKVMTIHKRKSVDTASDPYLEDEINVETAICRKCSAVYYNKRWYIDGEILKKYNLQVIEKVLCPACRKIRDRFPGGIIRLHGEFLNKHKEEIMNLIKNEEERARGFNPLERIIDISDTDNGVVEITTTNEKLAQRIVRSLERAYHGEVSYRWSHDTKLLRAEWVR